MFDDNRELSLACCRDALASITKHELAPTPHNYAVWYTYHARGNLSLSRALDIVISNRRAVDAQLMRDLYARFFSAEAEDLALRDTARRVQQTLSEVVGLLSGAGDDASRYSIALHEVSRQAESGDLDLPAAIGRLLSATRELAGRTETMGRRLEESAQRVAALEKTLAEVRRDATTDPLTGLMNRRAFDSSMRSVTGEAMNSGHPLALLIIDIDHFKAFNDTWGHPVGDAVLQLVGRRLQSRAPSGALPARFGGEEFVVLLPDTPPDDAVAAAEAIRSDLEAQRLVLRQSQQSVGRITVSIGVAHYEPGEPLADWLARADSALYRAKAAGRNRVVNAVTDEASPALQAVTA